MNGSKIKTPRNRLSKLKLDKSYDVTSSKYQCFDISLVTISKVWNEVTSSLIFAKMDCSINKRP